MADAAVIPTSQAQFLHRLVEVVRKHSGRTRQQYGEDEELGRQVGKGLEVNGGGEVHKELRSQLGWKRERIGFHRGGSAGGPEGEIGPENGGSAFREVGRAYASFQMTALSNVSI